MHVPVLIFNSDASATPEQQAEQIKAIYPVVDGQVAAPDSLDAHPSASTRVAPVAKPQEEQEGQGQEGQTKAEKPEKPEANDLIDFGQNDGPAAQPEPVVKDTPAKTPDEIEKMLASTGKKADGGPLLDFGEEMKKTLPAEDKKPSDSLG